MDHQGAVRGHLWRDGPASLGGDGGKCCLIAGEDLLLSVLKGSVSELSKCITLVRKTRV